MIMASFLTSLKLNESFYSFVVDGLKLKLLTIMSKYVTHESNWSEL